MDIRIIAAACIAGIYLSEAVRLWDVFIFILGILFVCIIKIFFGKRVILAIPVVAAVFFAGCALGTFSMSDEVNKSSEYISKDVIVTGRICTVPMQAENTVKYIVDAHYISEAGTESTISERIMVYYDGKFDYGDTVSFVGRLYRLPVQMNERGFDAEKYYRCRGITASLSAEIAYIPDFEIKDYSLEAFAERIRYSIDKLVGKYYIHDEAAVLKAVITGNKREFSDDMNEILIRTSTKGLFYPVYIHILIINSVMSALSTVLHKRKRDILTASVLVIYMLMNTQNAAFVRALSCAAAVIASGLLVKKVYYPDVFSAVVLINAVMNPLLIYDPCYISSMLSTVTIRTFYPYISKKIKLKNRGMLVKMIIMNMICNIGLIPVSTYLFNNVSLYSFLTTAVFFPAVALLLLSSPLLLVLLAVFGKAPIVGQITTSMVNLMLFVPKLIDKLPFSRIYVRSLPLILIFAYLMFVFALSYIIRKKTRHARCCLILSLILLVTYGVSFIINKNSIEVDFVNVGQGDGTLIKRPLGANIIIDGGGSAEYSDYDLGEKIYLPYLVQNGAAVIDVAFVSHYHKDHVQGVAAAIRNLHVKNLYMPDCMPESEWRRLLEETASEHNTAVHYISKNTKITFNDGLCINITVPDAETKMSVDANDTSLLIEVSYGEFNCLFTGDMTHFAERNLLKKGKVPQSDVLKIAHHGSEHSTCTEFFEKVNPEYSVISLGEDNLYNFPSEELTTRISASEVLRTDLCGDIRIISDKKGNIKIHTLRRE